MHKRLIIRVCACHILTTTMESRCESYQTFIIQIYGLYDSTGTAYIRQPCEPDSREPDRLLRKMNLGAVQGLREPPPLIWLVVAKCSGAT